MICQRQTRLDHVTALWRHFFLFMIAISVVAPLLSIHDRHKRSVLCSVCADLDLSLPRHSLRRALCWRGLLQPRAGLFRVRFSVPPAPSSARHVRYSRSGADISSPSSIALFSVCAHICTPPCCATLTLACLRLIVIMVNSGDHKV